MNTQIDFSSKTPYHVQAEHILRQMINTEKYRSGAILPNEVELAQELKISRNTLRQAINRLVNEGLLTRKKGVGTTVNTLGKASSNARNWMSFSQEMKMLGIEIRNFELHISLKRPTEEIGTFFDLGSNPDTRCVVMERVRGKKEYPFVYFISYFNPNIPLTGEEDYTRPLYEMLETQYNIVVKTSKEEISARLAGEFIAEKLEIKSNDPILIRRRFVYDVNGVPIEYNVGYYRADSFTYTIEAER